MPSAEDDAAAADLRTLRPDDIPTVGLPEAPTLVQPSTAGPSDGESEFQPGDVLAERYRITRFLQRGGMGEVYEAKDLALDERLALKTIRPEIAKNAVAVERFKREISIARKVAHPNVSRIHDLGIHHGTTETMFLTMEFLPGETLRERIVREGRMSEATALPLAEQIAAGLAAAHDAGVIHRDFKSANVMLVPGAPGQGEKAVVTDFGLARPVVYDDGKATISEADAVMGTPAYMAPEQVEGKHLTPAADLYSFGIVLYEMVTARRPFEGQTPLSTAVKRLTEAPPPPNLHVPELDPVWNAVLLRCLARQPEDRYPSALDVTRALRAGDTSTIGMGRPADHQMLPRAPSPPVEAPRRRRAPLLIAAGLMAVILAAAGLVYWRGRLPPVEPDSGRSSGPKVSLRRSVAVLGLRNNSGRAEAAWLSTAISEILATELSADGKLRVAAAEEVARLKNDLGLPDSDSLAAGTRQRIRSNLGVDSVVLGSYTLIGGPASSLLRIDVRVVEAAKGSVVASAGTSGTEAQLFDLVSRVGGSIRQKLGLGELTPSEALQVEASMPGTRRAMQLYTEGLAKLRLLDAVAARDLLLQAQQADDQHALTASALSSAYSALGYDQRAKEEAGRAVTLAGSLGREQKLQVEARFHEVSDDWEKAVEVHRSLSETFPDDVDHGVSLADALISAGRTKEALVQIEALRALPPPASLDARIDLVNARAHQEAGNFAMQQKAATDAAAKARANGSRIFLARARMLQATALLTLGEMQATLAAVDEARSLFEAAGDRGGMARALELTATCVRQQGDAASDRRLLERALAIHRETGDEGGAARVLLNMGTVLLEEGRASEAESHFDQALATFQRTGEKYAIATTLNDIGGMLFYSGDLVAAQERYQEALALFSALEDPAGTAHALTNIAEVLGCRGELEEARRMHEDSLGINRSIGDKGGIAYDLFRLGEIFTWRGDLVAAHARYTEALRFQEQIEDKLAAADTRVALAAIAIERGKAPDAESSARAAEEILRVEGAKERSHFALAVIAEALLAQGKQREASELADRTWKLAATSEDRRVRFAVATIMARTKAASKRPQDVDAALRALETARAEAAKRLFVVSELEARLAMAEIELAAGRAAGRQRLAEVERDARARGLQRIARRAAGANQRTALRRSALWAALTEVEPAALTASV